MTRVELKRISKAFGETQVLHDIDLDIKPGAFTVFVGPSGCGKSTLLRIIAGLEDASGGELLFDGRLMNSIAPAQRQVAMVFQSYALYPHMSAYENMAFALKLQGAAPGAIDEAVRSAARMLDIEHLLTRRPKELSGGQRQRVAIGRAIVRKPKLFLFDEPLSNLDAELRARMRYELAKLHAELNTTMIYVTHDQVEAMTLGTEIVALSGGRIEQVGPPSELYRRPANRFVAGFIGSPKMNFFDGEAAEGKVRLSQNVAIASPIASLTGKVSLGVRADDLTLADGDGAIPCVVDVIEQLGGAAYAYLSRTGAKDPVVMLMGRDQRLQRGDAVAIKAQEGAWHVFDEHGKAVAT
jgi:multiple sugar transport system ATP-binding protein